MDLVIPPTTILTRVPSEILFELTYQFLAYHEIIRLSQVCHDFHELFGSTSLIWKLLYQRDFSEHIKPPDGLYKRAYLKSQRNHESFRRQSEAIAFTEAVRNGYEKLVERLHQCYINLDVYDRAMPVAARNGHLHVVKLLHSYGAGYYRTTMIGAAQCGLLDIVKFVLACGTPAYFMENPTAYDSAMIEASRNGHTEIVEFMLAHGATNYDEAMIEAAHGHYDIVKLMLDRGAKRYTRALDEAFRSKRRDIVELIVSRDETESDRCLIWAAEEGHSDLVDQMLIRVAEQATTIPHYDVPHIYQCAINRATCRAQNYPINSEAYRRQLEIVQQIGASFEHHIQNMMIHSPE